MCSAFTYRSTFVPRVIGVLLVIDGVSYIAYGFAHILALGFRKPSRALEPASDPDRDQAEAEKWSTRRHRLASAPVAQLV